MADAGEMRKMLQSGASEMGLELDEKIFSSLTDYLFLIQKWNRTYNLTAIRDMETMLTHHLLDSLSVVPYLKEAENILDVGAGAGLPGLVIAACCPEKEISLIDTVQKKTAFIGQAKIELNLKNVKVYTGRVEKLSVSRKFDAIISRAFSSLSDFVRLSSHLLEKNGTFYAMKGLFPEAEIAVLGPDWKVSRTVSLKVPGLDAQRHLLEIEAAA